MDVSALLIAAQSVDFAARSAAENQLKLFHEQNFPVYIGCIATELATPTKPLDSRRMAGILLKTMLTAKEEARKQQLPARWVALDPALKQHVRDALLATLTTEAKEVRHAAAMALAAVAAVDLPRKVSGWTDRQTMST
jgi:importin subunit beta-1